MSASVCLSVHSHTSKTARPNQTSRNFLYVLPEVVIRSFLDDNAVSYVLPVFWMTSRCHIMGRLARGVGNNDVGTVLQKVVKISSAFTRGRHFVWLCRRTQWLQIAHRGRSVMSVIALFGRCSHSRTVSRTIVYTRNDACPVGCRSEQTETTVGAEAYLLIYLLTTLCSDNCETSYIHRRVIINAQHNESGLLYSVTEEIGCNYGSIPAAISSMVHLL